MATTKIRMQRFYTVVSKPMGHHIQYTHLFYKAYSLEPRHTLHTLIYAVALLKISCYIILCQTYISLAFSVLVVMDLELSS